MLCLTAASAAQPAFPGAEGFGANVTTGGRSGTVYHVTNLNDTGSGSFRDAVSQPNRTIVFDVSGTINLGSNLSISRSNLTIAGQTAPGDGITLKGWRTSVGGTRNVIVRYIRCRPGDVNCPTFQDDAFQVDNSSNVVVDHVSSSWSIDEVLSVTGSTNVTVQWCLITDSLRNSCHVKGAHGYGSLIRYGGGSITYHHNLYADHVSRNPRGPSDNIRLDFVNNVVCNWGSTAGYNGNDDGDTPGFVNYGNFVGNYYLAGPNTTQNPLYIFDSGTANALQTQLYQSGNLMDTNKNGVLDGGDRGWSRFNPPFTTNLTYAFPSSVSNDTANLAYVRVVSSAGASVVRDAVDLRIISNVVRQSGLIIDSQTQVGGWPTLNSLPAPLDSDQDGMPNYWELAVGSNTNNAADRNALLPDGYTALEGYLNWLTVPHLAVQSNTVGYLDLRQYAAGVSNAVYSVSSGSNGLVTLLANGYTAQFVPTNGFIGLASFQFVAAGIPVNLTGYVSVVVTPLAVASGNPPAPTVTVSPAATNLNAGQSCVFTAVPVGSPPFGYQWQFNYVNLTGETNATLSLTNLQPTDAGLYSVVVTNAGGTASATAVLNILTPPVAAILSNNPVAYWRLNEPAGPTAFDSVGYRNGTGEGGIVFGVAGVIDAPFNAFDAGNLAAQFNGTNSDVAVSALNLNTNTVTITGWIKLTGAQTNSSGIVFCRDGTTTSGLSISSANHLKYNWNNNASAYNWDPGLVVPDNQWTFIALAVSPSNAVLYVATNATPQSATNTLAHPVQAFAGATYLGYDPNQPVRRIRGLLDEVAIFNQTLTGSQISQILSAAQIVPPALTPLELWQFQYFGCTNCPQAAGTADPDGDGVINTNEFLAGSNPTNSASALRILSVAVQTNDIVITWATVGGKTNAVQATSGNYNTNFTDISVPVIIPGAGDMTTNYLDTGGATNVPARYYRIRLVQ